MSINYVTSRDNGLKILFKKGGLAKVHMVFRGGYSKVHYDPQEGGGGQKCPKTGPHGLRMPPSTYLY